MNLRTGFILHHLESMDAPSAIIHEKMQAEERKAFAHVDIFLATSLFSKHYLQKQKIKQPIAVVEPGMDMPTLSRQYHAEKRDVLMVANLIARKGILPWLEALTTVLKPTDAFNLLIVGRTDIEPTYAESCRQFVSQQPLLKRRVHFTGALPYHEVEKHYAHAQLFVSAARMETFGMALQEAKAYRIPLLILTGGYADQHGSTNGNGYVFKTLTEMADFFVNLVRSPTQLTDWKAAIDAQPLDMKYDWDEAARHFIQQLN